MDQFKIYFSIGVYFIFNFVLYLSVFTSNVCFSQMPYSPKFSNCHFPDCMYLSFQLNRSYIVILLVFA